MTSKTDLLMAIRNKVFAIETNVCTLERRNMDPNNNDVFRDLTLSLEQLKLLVRDSTWENVE